MQVLAIIYTVLLGLGGLGGTAQERDCNIESIKQGIVFYRTSTWEWQTQRDTKKTRSSFSERRTESCAYLRWVADLWRTRSKMARRSFELWYERVYAKFECIHKHEGSWDAINPAGYYGGLQMDLQFQRTYGSEFVTKYGTAEKWPVWAQLVAAERAYHGYNGYKARYFGPWPTHARYCA